jgi:hypothetical protein
MSKLLTAVGLALGASVALAGPAFAADGPPQPQGTVSPQQCKDDGGHVIPPQAEHVPYFHGGFCAGGKDDGKPVVLVPKR